MKLIYLYGTILAAAALTVSCAADEGTTPGNDANPVVSIFSHEPELPYNSDNDVAIRFAANQQTESAYYLVESTDEMNARMASMGEAGYMDYVVSNGIKLSLDKNNVADALLTDLMGSNTISAVGVNAGKKYLSQTEFVGMIWETIAEGTYYFSILGSRLGLEPRQTVLQKSSNVEGVYRFKDLFQEAYHLKITTLDLWGEDYGGVYQYFRIPQGQRTGYDYGENGPIFVRDIGYWQGSDVWITDNGYESGMYEDGSCFVFAQYYVSAGSLGYDYDEFIAD